MTSSRPSAFLFESNPGTQNCNPGGIGFWALVKEDFLTHDRDLFSQGFWAVFWHRFGNWRMSIRVKLLRAPISMAYRIMSKIVEVLCGIYIPYTVRLGRRVKLEHFGGMILVAQSIGDNVIIRQNTTIGISSLQKLDARPVIESGVEIGAGSVIIGGIYVGRNSIVGANAVVVRDVEANSIVAGVPARVIGQRRDV